MFKNPLQVCEALQFINDSPLSGKVQQPFCLYPKANPLEANFVFSSKYLIGSRNAPYVSTFPSGLAVVAMEIAILLF